MDAFNRPLEPARVGRPVYVIASGEIEARAGLMAARCSALMQHASLVLLVPHIVPYGTELNACGHDLQAIGNRYRPIAEEIGVDTTVHVCACREPRHVFGRMLVENAAVFVPGRRGRWRRSAAEKLADTLHHLGHQATFVDVDAPPTATTVVPLVRHSHVVTFHQPRRHSPLSGLFQGIFGGL